MQRLFHPVSVSFFFIHPPQKKNSSLQLVHFDSWMCQLTNKKFPLISTVYNYNSTSLVLYTRQTEWDLLWFLKQCLAFLSEGDQASMPVLPLLYIALWFSVLSWQEGQDGDLPVVCLACLWRFPQSCALVSPSFLFSTWAPILSIRLCLTEADRKCLIMILWPGFCCIPQIVYVMCSAHLSWCYFIPAVSKRMTKIFMYSQLIVTCLWSVLAQKTNEQFFPIINKC